MDELYLNGKIYRLVCEDGYYYIGSTRTELRFRLAKHKKDSLIDTERKVYKHINSIGWDNVIIDLIEEFPCGSKQELTEREDFYIKELKDDEMCLNIIRSNVPPEEKKILLKEYYEAHKEEIMEKHRDYNEKNREKVDQYQSDYRLVNAQKRREYTRNYAKEHPEWKLQSDREYYEKNKEKIIETNTKYAIANKEKVAERKRNWAVKKKEEMKEEIEKKREERLQVKAAKKAEKKANDEQVILCECGGSYQPYRKSRHDSSKKHQAHIV